MFQFLDYQLQAWKVKKKKLNYILFWASLHIQTLASWIIACVPVNLVGKKEKEKKGKKKKNHDVADKVTILYCLSKWILELLW